MNEQPRHSLSSRDSCPSSHLAVPSFLLRMLSMFKDESSLRQLKGRLDRVGAVPIILTWPSSQFLKRTSSIPTQNERVLVRARRSDRLCKGEEIGALCEKIMSGDCRDLIQKR